MEAIKIQLSEIALLHLSNCQATKSFATQMLVVPRSLHIMDIRSYHGILPKMRFAHCRKTVVGCLEEGTDLAKKMRYYSDSKIHRPSFVDYSSEKTIDLILFLC